MRKIIFILMVMTMVLCMMPGAAWADTGTGTEPEPGTAIGDGDVTVDDLSSDAKPIYEACNALVQELKPTDEGSGVVGTGNINELSAAVNGFKNMSDQDGICQGVSLQNNTSS